MLRPVRPEADPRSELVGAARGHALGCGGRARPDRDRPRQRRDPRCHGRLRAGRPVDRARARASVPGRGRGRPGRLRIAWTAEPPFETNVHPDCVAAARQTAELLVALGHEVEEAAPEFDGEALLEPFVRIWATSNLADYRAARDELGREPERDELEITTWELIEYARRFDGGGLLEAIDTLAAASRRVGRFFERYDAWVTPTLAQPPLPLGIAEPVLRRCRRMVDLRLPVQPLEPDREHDRPAGDVAAAELDRGRPAGRHPHLRPVRGGVDPVPAGRPARDRSPVAGPPARDPRSLVVCPVTNPSTVQPASSQGA